MSSSSDARLMDDPEKVSDADRNSNISVLGSGTPESVSDLAQSGMVDDREPPSRDGDGLQVELPASRFAPRNQTGSASRSEADGMTPKDAMTPTESMKKQYEAKLKDVMEKARDHAKKIANERDDLRRQCDEKETRLLQFKQLMNRATGELEAKESRIQELETQLAVSSSKLVRVEAQLDAMESHFTKPPDGHIECVLSVSDLGGTEWVLTAENRWWKRQQLYSDLDLSGVVHLSFSVLKKHQEELRSYEAQLEAKSVEFQEYKKKVDLLLSERSTPRTADSDKGFEATRKMMKLEEDLTSSISTNVLLKKQISELKSVERNLLGQLSSAKSEISKVLEPVGQMESKIEALEEDKNKLIEKLAASRLNFIELSRQLEEARAALAFLAPSSQQDNFSSHQDMTASTPPVENKMTWATVSTSTACQTETQLFFHSEERDRPAISAPITSQHDAVAIPLRSQIRQLMVDLEKEREDHALTVDALGKIKLELHNLVSEKKLASDLTDPVKVEYMRNVARRFVSLAPGSDEFDQLIPVILNFFGLDGDEAAKLIQQRKKPPAAALASLWS